MPRHPLPGTNAAGEDNYVDLIDRKLKRRDRTDIMRGAAAASPDDDPLGRGIASFDQVLVRVVHSWNLTDDEGRPRPLPKDDPTVLDDLDLDVAAALETTIEPIMNMMTGRRVDPADKDPAGPSAPSNASSR